MKNKKKLIIVITIFIVITIIIMLINLLNKRNLFNKFVVDISDSIVDKLDYKTVSGDIDLNIKVDFLTNGCSIISDMDYTGNYQMDLEKGLINIDGKVIYNKDKLDNNIYIKDNKIYILADDVYDKSVSFDVDYLTFLKHNDEYIYIINTFSKEINRILNKDYYTYSKEKLDGKKVYKTELNLTGKKYSKLKKELEKSLLSNEKFVEKLSKYKNFSKEETKKYIKDYNFENYKFTLYTSNSFNKFIRFEFNTDEIDFTLEYKDEEYYFEYYLRDGLIYSGQIKLDNGNISKFNLQDIIYQLDFKINVDKNNVKYNNNVKVTNSIDFDKVVSYTKLTDKDKKIMKKNSTINDIYDKYRRRFVLNITERESLSTEKESVKERKLDER